MADVQAMITKRANKYREPLHRKQFIHQVNNPPVRDLGDMIIRRTGSSVYYPFWHGYDGIGSKIGNGSQYDVAYAAGKFRKELEKKGLLPKINARKTDPVSGVLIKEEDGE